MKPPFLTSRESAILEAWRACEVAVRREERNQALVDVSSILGWLTCKDYSREYLFEMVVNAFENASTDLDVGSAIRRNTIFYRELLNKEKATQ